MSDLFDTLQERYQALLIRREKGASDQELLDDIKTFIADAQQAGATIADLNERSQLRAWMRFLANVVYDATGVHPDITLQPLTRGQLIGPLPERAEKPPPSFPLGWMLIGGAAVIIIVVGFLAMWWFPRFTTSTETTPAPAPTPAPVPYVSRVVVGAEQGPAGTLSMGADTFCLGTSEIVAEFSLQDVEADTMWRWEVQREGQVVKRQPATPWGRETQHTAPVLTGGPEGVEPGQYELLVYTLMGGQGAEAQASQVEQVVAVYSFEVLDTAPRAFDLQVTDVPEPAQQPPGGSDELGRTEGTEFEPGVRVVYLSYKYEGFCPELEISYTLSREGEPIQESQESWSGPSQGTGQVSFQAPSEGPFAPGDYEIAVAIAGQEQASAAFTIREEELTEAPPGFSDVTIALGVQPDGTPILTTPDNRFDWNTKVVYAIFDYVGMSDGLRWSVLWTRNDEEVARQEKFWDVETYGTEGTRWVAYYDEGGRTLPGGDYSVTLYIGNVAEQSAEFSIRYFVPAQ